MLNVKTNMLSVDQVKGDANSHDPYKAPPSPKVEVIDEV